MDDKLKCKACKHKNFRKNNGNLWDLHRILRLDSESMKGKIDKEGFIKINNFVVLQKTLIRGWKDKLYTGRKYLQTIYPTVDSHLKYVKNTQNSRARKI